MQGWSVQDAPHIKGEQYVFLCDQPFARHRLGGGDCYRLRER